MKTTFTKYILRAILILLLILNITAIIMGEAFGNSALNRLPVALLPVVSDSMKPMLKTGDAIITTQTDYEKLKTGDVIVYSRDGDLIVHEIIGFNGESVITKGIANEIADSPVTRAEYKARMLFKVPLLGAIWKLSSRPAGFIVFAVLLILLIFGDQIFSLIYKKVFERNEESQKSEDN